MIVRMNARLEIVFGRVDEDGEVVNPTPMSFALGKLCDGEWLRVKAAVEAKQVELRAALEGWLAEVAPEPAPAPEVIDEEPATTDHEEESDHAGSEDGV